jgi:hypothetical protein
VSPRDELFFASGDHTPTMKDVHAIMAGLKSTASVNNEPVLAVHQEEQMRAKNKGYPQHMYHAKLDALIVSNPEQRGAAMGLGYTASYQHREYPKFLHRRNMEAKFEAADYVESRQVASKEQEDALRKVKAKNGQSPWVESLDKVEPLPDEPIEDPQVTIARLQGQLEARGK